MLDITVFFNSVAVASLILSSSWRPYHVQQDLETYLPQGAAIEEIRTYDEQGLLVGSKPAIFYSDFNSDRIDELAVMYAFDPSDPLRRKLYLRILQKQNLGYTLLFDYHSPGKYLFSDEGVKVLDLNGDGKKEIALISSNSTSLGGILDIFVFSSGRFSKVFERAGFSYKGVSFQDLDKNGKLELILAARYTGDINTPSDIFTWKDGTYVLANEAFPEFYRQEIKRYTRLLDEAPADEPLFALGVLRFIAQEYQLLKNRERAATFYSKILGMCEEALSKPEDQQRALRSAYQRYRAQALAGLKRNAMK